MDLATRVALRYHQALGNTDWVVQNPELQPTKLARRYIKGLLPIGVGTQFDVVRSVADIPDAVWSYRIYTVIDVTPLHAKDPLRVAFRLNVAGDGKAAGTVLLKQLKMNKTVSKGDVDSVIAQMTDLAVAVIKPLVLK